MMESEHYMDTADYISVMLQCENVIGPQLASRPGRLKYGLVSIAWVIVHMRKLSSPESGEFVHVSKPL